MSKRSLALVLSSSLLASFMPFMADAAPYEQEFIITAYYSPLPNQCCYVRGSYAADMELNGEGEHGADGTAVYPGMAAAPKIYAFGTRIVLPGIGTVTVHDRGGAIQVLDGNVHRLDLWVGSGEEGLARALAFGVRRLKATVYPVGGDQPDNHMDLEVLKAPIETLRSFRVAESSLLSLRVAKGDQSLSVKLLQETLKKLGYLKDKPNGNFGDATETALKAFQNDYNILDHSDALTERTAAFLAVVNDRQKKKDGLSFLESSGDLRPDDVAAVKRTLRYLGYYKGRTTPLVDTTFTTSVAAFQRDKNLVASTSEPAAGTLGPKTRKLIHLLWKQRIVAMKAEELLFVGRVKSLVADKGMLVSEFLGTGDHGAEVKKLQEFLADHGYLDQAKVSGTFGKDTEKALIAYQIQVKIVTKSSDRGAGFAGPATLAQVRHDIEHSAFLLVRAKGWNVL